MKKRVISLLLALACSLSLSVPALAADEFADAGDIQHSEAVSAVVKLGLMAGKSGNVFDPQGTVTRAEAAKIMTCLLMGVRGSDWLSIDPNTPIANPPFPTLKATGRSSTLNTAPPRERLSPRKTAILTPTGTSPSLSCCGWRRSPWAGSPRSSPRLPSGWASSTPWP